MDTPGPAEPTNPQGESQSIAPLNVEVGGAMSTAATLEELHATIREAAVAGAQVWLSTPEHPYPMLDLMVKDAFAVVHYFAEDGEVPSQAEHPAPGAPQEMEFPSGGAGESFVMPAASIVSLQDAVQCASEFAHLRQRPTAVGWEEL